MSFFNDRASEYVQFISMVFEIVGITLAYIEIRYKPLANKIETKILTEETRIRDFAYALLKNKLSVTLITVFITIVFFIEIPYLVGLFDKLIPNDWRNVENMVIWFTFPIIILFMALIVAVLMGDFVVWLNQFSDGHAIGALGVVITGLGLLGDTYQALTILVNG